MPYALGIDIGNTSTSAAIARRYGADWAEPETVALGQASASVPSVLVQVSPDLAVVAEEDTGTPGEHGVIRGFVRRVGDDVPLLVGAEPYRAQGLVATFAGWVVDQAAAAEGELPEQVVLSHPASWGPYRRGLLHQALWQIGLDGVTLLPEPVAVAEGYALGQPVPVGAAIAVYSLGGTGCECSVVRRTGSAAFEVLASIQGNDPLGGADFDDALLRWVLGQAGPAARGLDAEDPPARRALARLRDRCTTAKERLSTLAETTVEVRLPGVAVDVPVTRAQFEQLIRPALASTLDTLSHALRSAGTAPGDLHGAILAGGAARVPLVGMLVAAALPCPVFAADDPAASAAQGAAAAARMVGAWARASAPRPADGQLAVPGADAGTGENLEYPPPRPPVTVTPLVPPRHGPGRFSLRRTGGGVRATIMLAALLLVVGT